MNPKHFVVLALLTMGIFVPADAGTAESDSAVHQWAVPINVAEPQNFYKVSDALYRGGHVSRAGAAQLRCQGINTVVSLRMVDRDSRYITRAGLNYIQINFKAWQPDEDQVVEFLKIATDINCQPVYVYCNRGAERTGMMSAVYRVVVQGWSKEEALCEMTEGPFDYHARWQKVAQFVRDMDVDRIKRRAGLADK